MEPISENEILVANTSSLHGTYADTGDPIVAGIRAYLNMENARGGIYGRSLRLLHIDDHYDPELAVRAFHELVDHQHVFSYLSHFGSPSVNATLDLIRRTGIPAVGFATGLGRLYAEHTTSFSDGLNCFPIQPIYVTEGRVMVVRCISLFHARKIGVLYTSDDTGGDLMAGIHLQCRRLGLPFHSLQVMTDLSNLDRCVEDLKHTDPDCVILASPQAYFPLIAGGLERQDLRLPALTSYLNSTVTVAQQTDTLVKGSFDVYALSWLDYHGKRLDHLEEASSWLGDYAMNGYAHCGWISAYIFCEGLRRMGPGMPRWIDFPAVMERAPFQIPFGGTVNYAGGRRMGTEEMSLVQLDLSAPTGWRFIDGLHSINDLLGSL